MAVPFAAFSNFGADQTVKPPPLTPTPPAGAPTKAPAMGPPRPAPWLPMLLANPNAAARPLNTYESALMPNQPQYATYGAPLVPAVDLILAGMNQAYNQTRDSMRPMQAAGGGGGGVTWDIPYGVDPVWYKQFTAEHEGKTPEQIYRRDGEYAIAHALSDKAWGDQFYRTYGRPPSEYDWKASYYQRQNSFYGG